MDPIYALVVVTVVGMLLWAVIAVVFWLLRGFGLFDWSAHRTP